LSFSTHADAGMMNPSDFSGYKGFKGKVALREIRRTEPGHWARRNTVPGR
jgi:hypothetical protein